ncbi:MAG: queuosine salvage family protein [Myxococcota bacterium]|nr:queuosine salvage family protein [Myxococcota bacterium]
MGIFQDIREAAAQVASTSKWVTLDRGALEVLADALAAAPVEAPGDDPAHHRRENEGATLAFVLLLDAVNFGSGWFPHLQKRPGHSGYFTIAASLSDHFDREGVMDCARLAGIRAEDCAHIFGQPRDRAPVSELMDLFAQAWRDLAGLVGARFGGSFAALVEAADHRAEALVEILASMPLYRDVERYGRVEVPFYKRAQITCADLALAFAGSGFGHFEDLDELTLFADNLVPHVLRREGILVYRPDLLARINAEEEIALGSPEEVEIRAVAVHAVECLSRAMAERGRPAPPRSLDGLLWHRGQSAHMKAEPRHRTRCAYY